MKKETKKAGSEAGRLFSLSSLKKLAGLADEQGITGESKTDADSSFVPLKGEALGLEESFRFAPKCPLRS